MHYRYFFWIFLNIQVFIRRGLFEEKRKDEDSVSSEINLWNLNLDLNAILLVKLNIRSLFIPSVATGIPKKPRVHIPF